MKKIHLAASISFMLLVIFAIYLNTMNPVFNPDDSPETILASSCLGIQHAPGYPLFATAGKIFITGIPGNPGFRMNVFSSFLAMLLILVFIDTVRFLSRQMGFKDNNLTFMLSGLLLGVSYIIWNQATGAKGGIFILNMLFTAILVNTGLKEFKTPDTKRFYIAAYIVGLALSNHWASTIVLLPVIAWPFVRNIKHYDKQAVFLSPVIFLIGLTPYLYLFIRGAASPVLNYGSVDSFTSFLWMITRQAYSYPAMFVPEIVAYQLKGSLDFILIQFSLSALIVPAGFIYLKKHYSRAAGFLLILFILSFFAAVFYNQVNKDALWLMHIYLMPFAYLGFIFIAAAIVYLVNLNKKPFIHILAVILITACYATAYNHNRRTLAYTAYDFGNNIALNSSGGIYIAEYDTDSMPFYYLQDIQKKYASTIKVIPYFLNFEWGRHNFEKRYGTRTDDTNQLKAIGSIIRRNAQSKRIFKSIRTKTEDDYSQFGVLKNNGLVNELNPKHLADFSAKLVNLRGITQKKVYAIKREINPDYYIALRYPVFLLNYGNRLLDEKRYKEALFVYKLALGLSLTPEIPKNIIIHNMKLAASNL